MRSQIRLGKIFGIEIGLHYSWFLIALLIGTSLFAQFHTKNPEWGDGVILAMSIVTGLLFFVSLLVHELAHSLFASSHGLPVKEITLFALGGVSQIEKEPASVRSATLAPAGACPSQCERRSAPPTAGGEELRSVC